MIKKEIRLLCLVGLIFGLTLSFPLHALDPEKLMTQYIHKKWTTEDGLPSNHITAIRQTSDGYIWIGTNDGLARFDGVKFETFNKNNTTGIPDSRITELLESRNKTLWIGTRSGLVVFKNGTFLCRTKENGMLYPVILGLGEDSKGNVWVGYRGSGVSVFEHGDFSSPFHPPELAGIPVVQDFYLDNRENLWMGTIVGLLRLKNRTPEMVLQEKIKGRTPQLPILSLTADKKENLWIGTIRNGLMRYNPEDKTFKTYNTSAGFKSNLVNTVAVDKDGIIWAGTEGGGLHRIVDGKISLFSEKNGLSNNAVNCLYEDREGNLWIGTYSGLNLLVDGKFTVYTEKEGLLNNNTWTVYEDRQKKMWITTSEGLNAFQNGRFTTYKTASGLSSDLVSTTWEDKKGNLWVGTYDKGLNRLKNGVFKHVEPKQKFNAKSIRAVYGDTKGNLWVGTYGQGLFKLPEELVPSGEFIPLHSKFGFPSDHIFAIYEDRGGRLWIGSDGSGLFLLEENKLSVYTTKSGLSSNVVCSILEDKDKPGMFWIGTENGGLNLLREGPPSPPHDIYINLYDPVKKNAFWTIQKPLKDPGQNGKIVPITVKDGLKDGAVYHIVEDDNGFFWMSGAKGISWVRKKELYDFAEGKIDRVTPTLFGKADGLKSESCSGTFQPAGWRTSGDGKIWFPTTHGLVSIDPNKNKINTIPPPVRVETILLDGKPADTSSPLVLEPDINRVDIHYTALSFTEPRSVRFKYIMEGFDKEWTAAGKRKDRLATYTNIPPGKYTFRVIACNNDGIWNTKGHSLNLTVLAPFWQKWWFIVICVVLFGVLSYFAGSSLKHLLHIIDFWRKKNYVGKYRIIDKIGSGGMANIFKAVSGKGSHKRFQALKLMKEEYMFDKVYRKRFLDEGAVVDNLDHPHIVKIFERGEHNHNLFIAMELLEGQTLDRCLEQKGRLTPEEGLDIIVQVLDALCRIHGAGIIHRDVKPGNIMLVQKKDKENFVKILDFGLARSQSITRVTESGMVVGTLNYLSPEQLLNSCYSSASDIYALGVIFYELLTGQRPYHGETPLEIMQAIFKAKIEEPKNINPDISSKLNTVILNMMNKTPEERPSAEVLRMTLQKLKS